MKWKKNEIVMRSESPCGANQEGREIPRVKDPKVTPGRLRMGSVFGCGRVSFGESPRTIVHYMTVCHTFMCIHLIVECCEIVYNIRY